MTCVCSYLYGVVANCVYGTQYSVTYVFLHSNWQHNLLKRFFPLSKSKLRQFLSTHPPYKGTPTVVQERIAMFVSFSCQFVVSVVVGLFLLSSNSTSRRRHGLGGIVLALRAQMRFNNADKLLITLLPYYYIFAPKRFFFLIWYYLIYLSGVLNELNLFMLLRRIVKLYR